MFTVLDYILVVDDDPAINRMFCKQLESAGLQCSGVEGVEAALALLESGRVPSMLILDLELADGDGRTVLDYLQAHHLTETKIVVVSANAYTRDYDLSGYRIDHVLVKPVSPRGLSALVHDLMK